jgi:hypothetical protein
MSERFEQLKAEAEKCEQLAAEAQSAGARANWLSLAEQWWQLAHQIDRLERERGPKGGKMGAPEGERN